MIVALQPPSDSDPWHDSEEARFWMAQAEMEHARAVEAEARAEAAEARAERAEVLQVRTVAVLRSTKLKETQRIRYLAAAFELHYRRSNGDPDDFNDFDPYDVARSGGINAMPSGDNDGARKMRRKGAKLAGQALKDLVSLGLAESRHEYERDERNEIVKSKIVARPIHDDLLETLQVLATIGQERPPKNNRGRNDNRRKNVEPRDAPVADPPAAKVVCPTCGSEHLTFDCYYCGAVDQPLSRLRVEMADREDAPLPETKVSEPISKFWKSELVEGNGFQNADLPAPPVPTGRHRRRWAP